MAGRRAGGQVAVLCTGHAAWVVAVPEARQFPLRSRMVTAHACSTNVLLPVFERPWPHTDFIVRRERSLCTGQVQAPGTGWSGGSAAAGQGGHTGQRRQQPCVYVNPTEEHGLVQPLIMVVQQHGCAVHGGEAQSRDPHLQGEEEPSGGGPAPSTTHCPPPASSSPLGGSGCRWQRGRSPAPA